ncbi:hypothetical protein [Millisia brevis]|uniref:hypothetical protein n=1 Tax=Millisia brevis TaxID=264148 RepID=UPI00082AF542|nr:hypothetical protein [Millisia brevis]
MVAADDPAAHTVGDTTVRRFRRSDRDQLADLVNRHARAVVPGLSVPVNTVLNQLEREPGEFIVDRWVVERFALVAEQSGRITAACLVLRYAADATVPAGYRGCVEIAWILHVPDSPIWSDASRAGRAVLTAAMALARRRGARAVLADGRLPVGGVYGIPRQWPHIQRMLREAGFVPEHSSETGWAARVSDLVVGSARPEAARSDAARSDTGRSDAARSEVDITRSVGGLGTVLTASIRGNRIGWIEVDDITVGPGVRCADVANLYVESQHAEREHVDARTVAAELIRRAAHWLALGGVELLLAYADDADEALAEVLSIVGFEKIFETDRGWRLIEPTG